MLIDESVPSAPRYVVRGRVTLADASELRHARGIQIASIACVRCHALHQLYYHQLYEMRMKQHIALAC
jgi:hypothetical protein